MLFTRIFTSLQRNFDNTFYPVFICGVAGSGTTLLCSLLDQQYLNAACLPESALMMPEDSVLKMKSVGSYGSLANYYNHMFIPANIPIRAVRRANLKALP